MLDPKSLKKTLQKWDIDLYLLQIGVSRIFRLQVLEDFSALHQEYPQDGGSLREKKKVIKAVAKCPGLNNPRPYKRQTEENARSVMSFEPTNQRTGSYKWKAANDNCPRAKNQK